MKVHQYLTPQAARAHRVEVLNPSGRLTLEHAETIQRELLQDEATEALYALSERVRRRFGVSFLVGVGESISRQSGLRSTSDVRPPVSNRSFTTPSLEKYRTEMGCCRMQQKRLHKSHERSPRQGDGLQSAMLAAKQAIEAALEKGEVAAPPCNELSNYRDAGLYAPRDLVDISSSDSLDELSHQSSWRDSDEEDVRQHEDVKEVLRLPQLPYASSPPHSRRPVSSRTALKGLAGCRIEPAGEDVLSSCR
jgi:hypothetical protein